MKYIDINKLESIYNDLHGTNEFKQWLTDAEEHLSNIRTLSKSERAKYWNKHNFWTKLYSALSKLSGHTCWYSEAPEGSGEWEIDHYRPKALSKDYTKETILEDGYWWISYYWQNFRLIGSLLNKLRKDKFKSNDIVFGKGNYFPLLDNTKVSLPEDKYCRGEIPLLIDPIKIQDIALIFFDKNGEVFPSYNFNENPIYYKKARISIDFYGLQHTSLVRGRKKTWDKCDILVDITNNDLKVHINDVLKRNELIEQCYEQLIKYLDKEEPYTMVVKSFLNEKVRNQEYSWLKRLNQAIGN